MSHDECNTQDNNYRAICSAEGCKATAVEVVARGRSFDRYTDRAASNRWISQDLHPSGHIVVEDLTSYYWTGTTGYAKQYM